MNTRKKKLTVVSVVHIDYLDHEFNRFINRFYPAKSRSKKQLIALKRAYYMGAIALFLHDSDTKKEIKNKDKQIKHMLNVINAALDFVEQLNK